MIQVEALVLYCCIDAGGERLSIFPVKRYLSPSKYSRELDIPPYTRPQRWARVADTRDDNFSDFIRLVRKLDPR